MVTLLHQFESSKDKKLSFNADFKAWKAVVSDLKLDSSKAHIMFYHVLLFNLAINKEVLTSELLTNYIDFSEILYLLLLLKLNEDNTVEKYSKFLVVSNDNLITWGQALMDATLMHNMMAKTTANRTLLNKIQQILQQLVAEQELLLNTEYIVHNLWINEGMTLPNSDDPSQTIIKNDNVIIENIDF